MANLIPPPGTRGLYSLKAPFETALQPNELYTCSAIRSFKDIENNNKVVLDTYYTPYLLTQSDVETDRKNGVYIVTLVSDKYAPVYVPSSYILSYPDQSNKPYQRVVASVDLGPLPDALDLTFVKTQIQTAVSQSFGVTPTVNIAVAPMTGVVTADDDQAREAARQGAITNSTTDYAKYIAEQTKNTQLEERLAILEKLVVDNHLLEPSS